MTRMNDLEFFEALVAETDKAIALREQATQIIPKLSATRAAALRDIQEGRHFDVHLREMSGLLAWKLIDVAQIAGEKRPTSAWTTDLGKQVLIQLAVPDDASNS